MALFWVVTAAKLGTSICAEVARRHFAVHLSACQMVKLKHAAEITGV